MSRFIRRLVFLFICLSLFGCSGTDGNGQKHYHAGPDPDDPSVVYDSPFVSVHGFKIYNGQAYDKACLWIGDTVKLIVPDQQTRIVQGAEPHVIRISMEKWTRHGSHPSQSEWPIPGARIRMGCGVKLEKECLLIGTYGESSYKEGANGIRLVIRVPKEVEVERRAGLIGDRKARSTRQKPVDQLDPASECRGPALSTKHQDRTECWLAPTVEDSWHEIPVVPDAKRQSS
jgi:hypothetical protein